MWWMMAALAADGIAYEPKVAVPALDDDAVVVGGSPPALAIDLATMTKADDRHRLRWLDQDEAETTDRDSPLAFSALEDERQRLVLGIKPGLRRARIGFEYRLALGM